MRISLYDYVTLECAELDYINTKYSLEMAEMNYNSYVEVTVAIPGKLVSDVWKMLKEMVAKLIEWLRKILYHVVTGFENMYNKYIKLNSEGRKVEIQWYDVRFGQFKRVLLGGKLILQDIEALTKEYNDMKPENIPMYKALTGIKNAKESLSTLEGLQKNLDKEFKKQDMSDVADNVPVNVKKDKEAIAKGIMKMIQVFSNRLKENIQAFNEGMKKVKELGNNIKE